MIWGGLHTTGNSPEVSGGGIAGGAVDAGGAPEYLDPPVQGSWPVDDAATGAAGGSVFGALYREAPAQVL